MDTRQVMEGELHSDTANYMRSLTIDWSKSTFLFLLRANIKISKFPNR